MFTRNSIVLSNNIKTPLTAISRAIGNILQLTYGQLVKQLFSNQEQGFAYDPNDLTTLYQDAAGNIPVTGAGQPVGLILDKSKGLVLGSELVTNGNFDNSTGWALTSGVTIVGGNLVSNSTSNSSATTSLLSPIPVGSIIEVSYNLTSFTSGNPRFYLGGGDNKYIPTSLGKNKFRMLVTAQTTTVAWYSGYAGTGGVWSIDDFSVKVLQGNHAYQSVSASRPILQRNATTGAYYLAFDGVDDFLQTNNIDFTATGKVSLFAVVRKLSDINAQILVELSADQTANSGSFVLMPRQIGIAEGASFRSRGSLYNSILNVAGLKAPLSTVFTAKADIQGDSSILRSNGVQVGGLNVDQGTGNYGNYPLYIGRRAGASLPFDGHLYSLIGIARLTTDSETIALEKSISKNVGVALNV